MNKAAESKQKARVPAKRAMTRMRFTRKEQMKRMNVKTVMNTIRNAGKKIERQFDGFGEFGNLGKRGSWKGVSVPKDET